MEPGINNKYDVLYNNSDMTVKGKPKDTGKQQEMIQPNMCASGTLCRCKDLPLTTRHRCIVCAFCVHTECSFETKETQRHKAPSTSINLICKACAETGGMTKLVKNKELSLGLYSVHKYIRPQYPKITIDIEANDTMDTEDNANGKSDSEEDDSNDTNDDDTIGQKNNNNNNNDKKKGKEKNRVKTPPTYMDLHLAIPPAENQSSPLQAIEALKIRLEEWLQGVQSIEKSFKIHTVDPDSKVQTSIHHQATFPETLPEIKQFFKGARPIPKGGKLYMTIKASFEGNPQELRGSTEWYHAMNKERFAVAALQTCHKVVVGWLLYSLRSMDEQTLKTTIEEIIGEPISLRWMRISDGSYAKGRDYSKDPRALHVECARQHSPTVQKELQKLYNSKAKSFPLHIRMRFVPQIQQLLDLQSKRKAHQLANRQMGWTTQCQMLSRDDIIEIDRPIDETNTTLRDVIMAIKNINNENIFSSIDRKWNGQGFNFSFHPKFAEEGPITIRGLYPRIFYSHGERVNKFFSPSAVIQGQQMKYDPNTHSVTSEADETINDLMEADPDMEFTVDEEKESNKMIFEKVRNDDDSVSTFNKSKRSHPEEIDMETSKRARMSDQDDSSSTSSISANTKRTIDTRITRLEANIHGMEDRIESKITATITNLFRALNPSMTTPNNNRTSTNTNNQQNNITPNKTRNESLELSEIDV